MQEFPEMSIGEIRTVENERGLIIKFKMSVQKANKCNLDEFQMRKQIYMVEGVGTVT